MWSARAVVKNDPFEEYFLEWIVGVIFILYWSGNRVFLLVGKFFRMFRDIECVSPLLSKVSQYWQSKISAQIFLRPRAS